MDLEQIQRMLQDQYSNDQPMKDYVSTATASINDQTNKRIRDLLSKFSTTGMGRSGISGAATNDIYSNAGKQISEVGAQGEQMDMNNKNQALQQLLGIAQYEDSKPTFGDILGGVGGSLLGSILGPAGAALGGGLGSSLTSLLGIGQNNTNNSFMPNYQNDFNNTANSFMNRRLTLGTR